MLFRSRREKTEVDIIKEMMKAYFEVLKIRTADIIPKIIVTFMVEKSVNELSSELIGGIIQGTDWVKLMEENSVIAEKRRNCKRIVQALTDSMKELSKMKNSNLVDEEGTSICIDAFLLER